MGLPVVLSILALWASIVAFCLTVAAANRRHECACGRVATVRVFAATGQSWRVCDECVGADACHVVPLPREVGL